MQYKIIFYRGAIGALLIYDITKHSSFENLEKWIKDLKDCGEHGTITFLVGNKCDLKNLRAVRTEEAQAFADRFEMNFIETSALDAVNVDLVFKKLVSGNNEHKNRFNHI